MSERWPGGLISKTPVTPSGPAPTSTAPGIWTIDQMNYWKARGLWPDASADPYWSYVSYLLSTTATNTQTNNTFLDSSTNNFTITRNGNTTQGSATPYGTLWSNYFDGSGDYLSVPSNAAFGYGTGDFTIEFWMYLTGTADQTIVSNLTSASSTNPHIYYSAGTIRYYTASADRITSGSIVVGQWYHVALSRASGSTKMFVNGVQAGSTYADSNNYGSTAPVGLATYWSGGSPVATNTFTGYMSDARFVKGTAVYTAAFTPPTAPLTAISGTSLLTCQSNRFKDNSTNNFAITANGNTSVTAFSPFVLAPPGYTTATNGGSGYFDGSGDYLSLAGASAFSIATSTTPFTVEAWIYPTAAGGVIFTEAYTGSGTIPISIVMATNANSMDPTGGRYIAFGAYNGSFWTTAAYSSSQIQLNTWTHVACVFTGSTTKIFFNGVDVTAGSPATTWPVTGVSGDGWYVGRRWDTYADVYFSGYISNFRFVNGTAVYTANFTPPTAPVTAITNTSLLLNFTNGGIYDASMNGNAETVGNAQVSSTQAKYGTTALYSPNSTSYLNGRFNQSMVFGTGDFTIEAWVYSVATSAGYTCITSSRDGIASNANAVFFGLKPTTNQLTFYTSSEIIGTSTAVSTGTWTHVALVRNAGATAIYINGTSAGTATFTTSLTGTGMSVGNEYNGASGSGGIYIDDLRVTKGYARYTANFTPPTAALPVY